MERRILDPGELDAALATLPEWRVVEGRLRREFTFPDFVAAFGFMSRVALLAERMNHHPDWHNSYNRVTVELTTHDLDALSTWDLELARRIDTLVG